MSFNAKFFDMLWTMRSRFSLEPRLLTGRQVHLAFTLFSKQLAIQWDPPLFIRFSALTARPRLQRETDEAARERQKSLETELEERPG